MRDQRAANGLRGGYRGQLGPQRFQSGGVSGEAIRRFWRLTAPAGAAGGSWPSPSQGSSLAESAEQPGEVEPQSIAEAVEEPEREAERVAEREAERVADLSDSQKRDRAIRRIEAILFLSREPLSPRRLALLAGLADATQARTLTRQLNERYERHSQSLRVEETAGGYQLMTRPQFARWLRKLNHVPADLRLSQVALETLTIIAYRQPVVRAYIEAVRGANCEEVLRQLLERDLIRIAGRSEELGRPYVYGTTKRFLQAFGLRGIDQLPKKDWVLQSNVQFANPRGADSMQHTPNGNT